MRIRRTASVFLIVLLISYTASTLFGVILVPKVIAQEEVQVLPALNVYEIGQEFTVDIDVTYVEGVRSWQLELKFDPSIITTDTSMIDEGPFLQSGGQTLFIETVGANTIALSCLITVYSWADGGGRMANVTFRTVGNGRVDLDLFNTVFYDAALIPILDQPAPVDSVFYTTFPRAVFYYLPSTTAQPISGYTTPYHLSRDPFVDEIITFNATAHILEGRFFGSYDPNTATPGDPSGTITNYAWDFSDGTVISGSDPVTTHSFSASITYMVNLTVTDGEGKSTEYLAPVKPIIRDVSVSIIEVVPTLVSPGETVSVKVNITNYGNLGSTERVNVTLYQNDGATDTLIPYNVSRGLRAWSNVHERDPVGGSPPWQFIPGTPPITLNYTWQTAGLPVGNYTMWANISQVNDDAKKFLRDLYFREMDLNLANNIDVWGEVELEEIPNVAVTEIKLTPTLKPPNIIDYGVSQVTVQVKVENTGGFDATFNVTLHQDSTLLTEWTNIFLTSKTSTTLEYMWATSALSRGFYNLTAQASNITGEVENGRTGDNKLILEVLVTSAPVVAFAYSPVKPLVGEAVHIDASASQAAPSWSISTYTWRINGTIQPTYNDMVSIQHSFNSRALFNITLTVTDNATLGSSLSQLIYVGYLPAAQFTFSPVTPKVDETITFDSSSSAPDTATVSGDEIITYMWDFGDGTKVIYAGVNLTETTTHSYARSGNFSVTLKVFDGEDFNATITKFVLVSKITSGVTVSLNAQTIQVGQNVTISGQVTPTRGGAKVSILYKTATTDWTLLQNVTSNQAGSYQHTWTINTAGNYTVKARFAGDDKYVNSESPTANIQVQSTSPPPPPPPSLDLTPYIIGAIILIVVIGVGIYLIRRRK